MLRISCVILLWHFLCLEYYYYAKEEDDPLIDEFIPVCDSVRHHGKVWIWFNFQRMVPFRSGVMTVVIAGKVM